MKTLLHFAGSIFSALVLGVFSVLTFCVQNIAAQEAGGIPLRDLNGDKQVSLIAFGDSITRGVGDGIPPGAFVPDLSTSSAQGYPTRIQAIAGVPVLNAGVSGEQIALGGIRRFPNLVNSTPADLILILEGTNDSIVRLNSGEYGRLLQKMINVARALGRLPVLVTIPAPCCNHTGREPFTASYSAKVRELAALNEVPITDVERAWQTTCVNRSQCELYNLPEGLHPNLVGYDVIAQTVLATLYGIDIFAPGGAQQLESAAGLSPGTVIVKPST